MRKFPESGRIPKDAGERLGGVDSWGLVACGALASVAISLGVAQACENSEATNRLGEELEVAMLDDGFDVAEATTVSPGSDTFGYSVQIGECTLRGVAELDRDDDGTIDTHSYFIDEYETADVGARFTPGVVPRYIFDDVEHLEEKLGPNPCIALIEE